MDSLAVQILLGVLALLVSGTGGGFMYRMYKAAKTEGRADRAQSAKERTASQEMSMREDSAIRSELLHMLRGERDRANELDLALKVQQESRMGEIEERSRLRAEISDCKRRILELEEAIFARDSKIEELSAQIQAEKLRFVDLVQRALDIQLADSRPLPPLPQTEPPLPPLPQSEPPHK